MTTLVRPFVFVVIVAAALPAALPAAAPARAEPPAWTIDYPQSRLTFAGSQAGVAFEGRFERFTADIRFDPVAPAEGRIDVTIDMASAVTDNRDRDAAIRGRDWFAVAEYPTAHFRTTGVRALADNRYQADATLTIRGITRPITLPFSLEPDGAATRARGEVAIVRTDYGVGQGSWSSGNTVGLDVVIRFDILARRVS